MRHGLHSPQAFVLLLHSPLTQKAQRSRPRGFVYFTGFVACICHPSLLLLCSYVRMLTWTTCSLTFFHLLWSCCRHISCVIYCVSFTLTDLFFLLSLAPLGIWKQTGLGRHNAIVWGERVALFFIYFYSSKLVYINKNVFYLSNTNLFPKITAAQMQRWNNWDRWQKCFQTKRNPLLPFFGLLTYLHVVPHCFKYAKRTLRWGSEHHTQRNWPQIWFLFEVQICSCMQILWGSSKVVTYTIGEKKECNSRVSYFWQE